MISTVNNTDTQTNSNSQTTSPSNSQTTSPVLSPINNDSSIINGELTNTHSSNNNDYDNTLVYRATFYNINKQKIETLSGTPDNLIVVKNAPILGNDYMFIGWERPELPGEYIQPGETLSFSEWGYELYAQYIAIKPEEQSFTIYLKYDDSTKEIIVKGNTYTLPEGKTVQNKTFAYWTYNDVIYKSGSIFYGTINKVYEFNAVYKTKISSTEKIDLSKLLHKFNKEYNYKTDNVVESVYQSITFNYALLSIVQLYFTNIYDFYSYTKMLNYCDLLFYKIEKSVNPDKDIKMIRNFDYENDEEIINKIYQYNLTIPNTVKVGSIIYYTEDEVNEYNEQIRQKYANHVSSPEHIEQIASTPECPESPEYPESPDSPSIIDDSPYNSPSSPNSPSEPYYDEYITTNTINYIIKNKSQANKYNSDFVDCAVKLTNNEFITNVLIDNISVEEDLYIFRLIDYKINEIYNNLIEEYKSSGNFLKFDLSGEHITVNYSYLFKNATENEYEIKLKIFISCIYKKISTFGFKYGATYACQNIFGKASYDNNNFSGYIDSYITQNHSNNLFKTALTIIEWKRVEKQTTDNYNGVTSDLSTQTYSNYTNTFSPSNTNNTYSETASNTTIQSDTQTIINNVTPLDNYTYVTYPIIISTYFEGLSALISYPTELLYNIFYLYYCWYNDKTYFDSDEYNQIIQQLKIHYGNINITDYVIQLANIITIYYSDNNIYVQINEQTINTNFCKLTLFKQDSLIYKSYIVSGNNNILNNIQQEGCYNAESDNVYTLDYKTYTQNNIKLSYVITAADKEYIKYIQNGNFHAVIYINKQPITCTNLFNFKKVSSAYVNNPIITAEFMFNEYEENYTLFQWTFINYLQNGLSSTINNDEYVTIYLFNIYKSIITVFGKLNIKNYYSIIPTKVDQAISNKLFYKLNKFDQYLEYDTNIDCLTLNLVYQVNHDDNAISLLLDRNLCTVLSPINKIDDIRNLDFDLGTFFMHQNMNYMNYGKNNECPIIEERTLINNTKNRYLGAYDLGFEEDIDYEDTDMLINFENNIVFYDDNNGNYYHAQNYYKYTDKFHQNNLQKIWLNYISNFLPNHIDFYNETTLLEKYDIFKIYTYAYEYILVDNINELYKIKYTLQTKYK